MNDPTGRLARLERQIEAILGRLTALEAGAAAPDTPGDALREPAAPEEASSTGEVAYRGSARFGRRRYEIRRRVRVSALFEVEPESLTRVFGALASPFRLLLLRALFEGPRTSQELQQVLGAASVGQLYHHLKELLAAGLITQPGRSVYAVSPDNVIAVCAALMAASNMARGGPGGQPSTPEPDDQFGGADGSEG